MPRARSSPAFQLTALVALAACGAPPAPAPPPPPPPVASAPAPPDAGAMPPPPAPPRWSPFTSLGEAPRSHYDFVGQVLFSDGERLGVVEGASIVYRPELTRGLPSAGSIDVAGGVWPGAAWVAVTTVEKDGGVSRVFRFHGDGWIEERAARRPRTLTSRIVAGPKGSAILLRAPDIGGRRQNGVLDDLEVVGSPPGVPVIQRGKVGVYATVLLHSRADGSVAALGQTLPNVHESPTLTLELWGPRDSKGRLTLLPDAPYASASDLCFVGSTELIVGDMMDGSRVWTYDGAHWTVEPMPANKNGACAADGSVFLIVGDHVEQRKSPGHWERIDLPEATPPFKPSELWAGETGALWVTAEGGGGKGFTILRAPLPVPARPSGAP